MGRLAVDSHQVSKLCNNSKMVSANKNGKVEQEWGCKASGQGTYHKDDIEHDMKDVKEIKILLNYNLTWVMPRICQLAIIPEGRTFQVERVAGNGLKAECVWYVLRTLRKLIG